MATPDNYSRKFYDYKTTPHFSPRVVVPNPGGPAGREARKNNRRDSQDPKKELELAPLGFKRLPSQSPSGVHIF